MDHARGTRIAVVALLAFAFAAGPATAEVKLRIYLQDGTLQSGSLVTETEKSFVVLTQEGRVEVPKSSIMFINGKTLKQWQERPDKLFQTEIIPSDIPNPAYVNDKSLPPPPPVPDMPASVTPPSARPVAKRAPKRAPVEKRREAAPTAPVENKTAAVQTPVEGKTAAAAEHPKPIAAPASKRAHRVRPVRETPAAVTASGPAAPSNSSPAAAAPERAPDPGVAVRRARFDRQSDGERHYQRALEFERAGETGRAIQEFQFARLLTPGNADVPLHLGRLCLAQGLTEQARKYFAHPLLRRNDEATSQISRIDSDRAEREEKEWRQKVAVVSGSFAWLPILIAMRLMRRRKRIGAQTTINADDLRPDEWLPEAEPEMASPVPAPAPTFEVIAPVPLPVEEAPPAPEPRKTFPGLPEFLKNLTTARPAAPPVPITPPAQEPAAEEPVAEEPTVVPPSTPFIEPSAPAVPEPVAEAPVFEPAPAPEPEPVAAAPIPAPDPTEILSLARTMEASLVRGNQHATEGRFEDARRSYRTALVFNPSCASAHLGLGYLAFCEEKWETSLLHYRKALEIDPTSADAHYGAARVLLEINRVDDALPELRATLQIDPTYDDARDTLTALSKPA